MGMDQYLESRIKSTPKIKRKVKELKQEILESYKISSAKHKAVLNEYALEPNNLTEKEYYNLPYSDSRIMKAYIYKKHYIESEEFQNFERIQKENNQRIKELTECKELAFWTRQDHLHYALMKNSTCLEHVDGRYRGEFSKQNCMGVVTSLEGLFIDCPKNISNFELFKNQYQEYIDLFKKLIDDFDFDRNQLSYTSSY